MSWLGPAFLVWGLWGLSPGRAALAAIAAGWVAHACILHWFFVVTVTYGHAPLAVGLLAPIGAAIYPALLMGIFGLGWGAWTRNGGSSPLFAAALWTAVHHRIPMLIVMYNNRTYGNDLGHQGTMAAVRGAMPERSGPCSTTVTAGCTPA